MGGMLTHVRRIKGILIVVALALMALMLRDCDEVPELGSGDGGRIEIRFWNGFTGPDGSTMLRIVERFNRENSDIRVIMQKIEWGTYYNKLFVAGVGGRAPDVFAIHSHTLTRFTGAKFVRPVDDLLGKGPDQFDPSDFDPNVWAAMERDGKHWAIPLDVHPLGMYYNKKMFREAGIVDEKGQAKPPTNRQEFLDDLRKLKRTGSRPQDQRWGFVFTWMRTNSYAVMRQFGGQMFDELMTRCTLASSTNVKAMDWMAGLVKDGLVPSPQDFDAWVGFRQGRVGMAFEGIYMLPDLKKQTDLDWGAAPLPVLGETPATWAGSHSLAMRSDLSGKKLAAVVKFVKYLSDNSLDWAEAGQVPARRSLRNSARFRSMYAQSEFARQIPYIQYFPATPFIFEFLRVYDDAVEPILRGTRTAEDSLTEAQGKIDDAMARYRREGWEVGR